MKFENADETPRLNDYKLHNSGGTNMIIYCVMDNVLCNYDRAYQTAIARKFDIKYPQ